MGWGEGYYHYLRFWPAVTFMRFMHFSLRIVTISCISIEYMAEEFHLFCTKYPDD
jgi:hypothetical protein